VLPLLNKIREGLLEGSQPLIEQLEVDRMLPLFERTAAMAATVRAWQVATCPDEVRAPVSADAQAFYA
jgi:hypothetical protein